MSDHSHDLVSRATETAVQVRALLGEVPQTAVVLGSGLGSLVEKLSDPVVVSYAALAHFPIPTVSGHAGNLIVGKFDGVGVLMLQGRFHFYEGHSLDAVTFPVRVLQFLGVRNLILTAATGGIKPEMRPGNLVCLSDHINLIGQNPLRGRHDERLGARFPDMTEVYSKKLRKLATEEGKRLGVNVIPGIYACLPGPSYETPAEIKMLRTLGADVVGMSTVPEAIVARQAGMDVLAFALVTNAAAGVVGTPITHQDVLEAGRKATPLLGKLIRRIVLRMAGVEPGKTGLTGEFTTLGGDP